MQFLIATLKGRIIAVDTESATPELLPYSATLGRGEIIGLTALPGHNAAKRAVVIAYKDGTICVFGLHEKSPLGTHAFIEEITTIEVTHQVRYKERKSFFFFWYTRLHVYFSI